MISAINPVSMTILPPERRAAQPLALPAPDTTAVQVTIEADTRPITPVRAVVEAYRETQTRPSRFLVDEPADQTERFGAPPQSLPKDGLLALHDFAQSPSLSIEPYGQAAQAYAQVQGLASQAYRAVDISV